MPRIPSSAMPSIRSMSSLWSMSFWTATGRTRSSTKARTVSWISRCSSLSSKSTRPSLLLGTPSNLAEEPERARPPGADQGDEEDRAGERERPAGEAVHAHDEHLRHEGAVEGDAEERVLDDPRRVGLEAELEDAVVGDRDDQEEGDPARPAVDEVDPAGPGPGKLAEDPRRREELRHAEHGRREREPGLQVERVAEEEAEPRPRVGAGVDDEL